MRREARVLLEDINLAAAGIERYTEGADLEAFLSDGQTRAAVERNLGIAGGALRRLHEHHPEIAGRIRRLRDVVDLGDLLILEYDRVDSEQVWSFATDLLPQLRRQVRALLAELD